MKHLPLSLFVSLLAAAGCAATVHSESGAGGGPSDNADAGADGSGPSVADPDDDDGPEWNGQLPGTPTLLAANATDYALTRDDQVVFLAPDGVKAMAATGGAITTVGTDPNVNIDRAGRAVLLRNLSTGALTAYSKAAGARAISGVTFASSAPQIFDTPSGDFAFVHEYNGRHWFFDATTLTMTAIDLPITTKFAFCRAYGETLACGEGNSDTPQSTVFTIDKSGAHVVATPSGFIGGPPILAGGDVLYASGDAAYRVAAGSSTPTVLLPSAVDLVPLQGDWLAATVGTGDASEVRVLKADGSQMKTIAAGNGVQIEGYSVNTDNRHDSARTRWLGICDNAKDLRTNLRVYDPSTDRTVPLSKASCDLRAITYSDNFAFVIDNAHITSDPIVPEAGDPTVFDLRDGSSRGNPTGQSYFQHDAIAIGKSKLLFEWLAFGYFRNGCYYDGHSSASMPGASFEGSLYQFAGYQLTAGAKGVVMPGRGDNDQYDLYYLAL